MDSFVTVSFKKKAVREFISVIIPVENDPAGLTLTLLSLKRQLYPQDRFEILVGNDGNFPKIREVCREFGVACYSVKKIIGSYAMRNRLMSESQGDILAFIDAQTQAREDWLEHGFDAVRRVDYVGGEIQVCQSETHPTSEGLFLYQQSLTFDVEEYMYQFHFASTTNLFVKRSLIERIGGFDSRLFSSGDFEFGDRVYASGLFLSVYDPRMRVLHVARRFWPLIHKQKRIALGHSMLPYLYPDRFLRFRVRLFGAFLRMIFPPVWIFLRNKVKKLSVSERMTVFGTHWIVNFYYYLYRCYFLLKKQVVSG